MFKHQWTTKQRLIRNVAFVVIAFLLIWTAAGMPALTPKGAFRRTMRANLTPHVRPSVLLKGDYGYSVLGESEGIWYQAATVRKWWIFWDNYEATGETEAVDEVCIVPLFLKDEILRVKKRLTGNWRIPDIAVQAEGESARLYVQVNGAGKDLEPLGKQNGWFLFKYPSDLTVTQDYRDFVNFQSSHLDCPEYRVQLLSGPLHGMILFESYDMNGIVVQQGAREF